MRLFKTRYRIEKNGRYWLTVMYKRWFWKWKFLGVARGMDDAMEIIECHRNPVVWRET